MAADFEPGLKAGEEEGEEVQLLVGQSSPSNHHWCHQHQHQHQHHRSARLSPLPPRPPWARPAPRFLPFCLKQRGLEGTRRQLGITNCSNCCPAAREPGRPAAAAAAEGVKGRRRLQKWPETGAAGPSRPADPVPLEQRRPSFKISKTYSLHFPIKVLKSMI